MTKLELGTGRPLDPATAWDHIGYWTLARVGAHPDTRWYAQDHVQFQMSCDRRKRKAIVQLNGNDHYDIEIGHTQRRTLEWVTDAVKRDVPAETLSQVIEDLYQQVMDR